MPARPRFSIIVPTFNVATTLRTCFDSIACQTWSDFEVILIDGGSTDSTIDIANGFESRLGTRLVIHSGPDKGAYDAMNRGVSIASGAWLLFLGADDALYGPDTLAQVAAFLDAHDHSDLVYGDVIMRSNSSRYAGAFDLDRLLFEQNICHQAIFYRRELFAGIGPFNLRYPIWADWDFNIRCFSNPALVARYMDIVVARYNDTGGISKRKDNALKKRLPSYFHWAAMEMTRRTLARLRHHIVGGWQARRTRSGPLQG